MNEKSTCPGCPECQPAGADVPVSGDSARHPLTKPEFIRLMVDAYVRYRRLPDPERETFDAASYVAGLEHGYRERNESHTPNASLLALCFTALVGFGILLGVALR